MGHQIRWYGRCHVIPEMLKGRALLWYRNNKLYWLNWEDVIRSFKLYYTPHRYQHKLEEEIRNRLQRTRESASEYITDILTLIRRHGGLSLESQLDRIYENLRTEYKYYIRPWDFRSLPELLEVAGEFERLPRSTAAESRIPSRPRVQFNHNLAAAPVRNASPEPPIRQPMVYENRNSFTQDIANPTDTYRREEVCWRCGEPGHTRNRCRGTYKKFCSRCNREGVFSKDCGCRESGNGHRQ
uniref:CCHC-type domain-containing protein n=1 Tax=Photinus pyralis TaxID=7054 RepID=A0A1Y1JZI1_PHOPY